jgi:hypothetical protein
MALNAASQRGRNISDPIHICDWYATFCELAGVDPTGTLESRDSVILFWLADRNRRWAVTPPDRHEGVPDIDSISQVETILGTATAPARTEVFVGPGVLIQDQV